MILEVSSALLGFASASADIQDSHYNRLDPTLFPYTKDAPESSSSSNPASMRSGGRLAPASSATRGPAPGSSGSLRSARPTWHKAPSARAMNTEGKQRIIMFVAGGMTYSEMRLAYAVGQSLGKEIYIGKSSVGMMSGDKVGLTGQDQHMSSRPKVTFGI